MRIPGNKPILLLLAALTALAIAGCGGGGDETETTTPTVEEPTALTQDELIEQGDGICAEVNAAVGALSSSETESGGSEKVANLYLGMVERLQDLGTPEGDDGSYAKFMEASEELAQVESEVKTAAESEDAAALEAAEAESGPALEEFQSQAAIYGFEDCSEGPGELPTPVEPGGTPGGEELEGEEGGVEPEYVEPAPEEEIVPEEEVAPETGGAGGGSEAPEPAPETGGGSGGVGPG
ncbi:MAG TPA: hypothetical protein VI039_10395 [Solirubrobacterales bacterium]